MVEHDPPIWWTPGTTYRPGPSRRSATPRADSPSAARAGISGSSSSSMIRGSPGRRFRSIPTAPPRSKPLTLALEPAKVIKGRITDADTGKPIPHAQLVVMASYGSHGWHPQRVRGRRRGPVPRQPPAGRPLRSFGRGSRRTALSDVAKLFNWPKGAVEYPIDLALPRGVLIRGKVTEEGSGKPVAGASISSRGTRTAEGPSFSPEWPRGQWAGWLVSDRGPAQPGLFRRPGPQRRLCAPERSAGRCFRRESPVAAASTPTPSSPATRKPTDATLDVNVVLRPGTTVTRPGRRAGRSADPGCLDDQPRARPAHVRTMAELAALETTAA